MVATKKKTKRKTPGDKQPRASKEKPPVRENFQLLELIRGAERLASELTFMVEAARQASRYNFEQRKDGRNLATFAVPAPDEKDIVAGFHDVKWIGSEKDALAAKRAADAGRPPKAPYDHLLEIVEHYLRGADRDGSQWLLGGELAGLAAFAATGRIQPKAALAKARLARCDGGPRKEREYELSEAMARRSLLARAQHLYDIFARGADVELVPDTKRGARPRLKQLLEKWLKNAANSDAIFDFEVDSPEDLLRKVKRD